MRVKKEVIQDLEDIIMTDGEEDKQMGTIALSAFDLSASTHPHFALSLPLSRSLESIDLMLLFWLHRLLILSSSSLAWVIIIV